MHYESKNHNKKKNIWFSEWSQTSNKPKPKPAPFHCDICDLALTSVQHARQHYLGEWHRTNAAGRTKPGSGYLGPHGRWIRLKTSANERGYHCLLCFFNASSPDEMISHVRGSAHENLLISNGALPIPPEFNYLLHELAKEKLEYDKLKQAISIYRTTSGNYYCKPCDCTIANEQKFAQHLDSDSHERICCLF